MAADLLKKAALLSCMSALFSGCLERHEGDTADRQGECSQCHGGLLKGPHRAAPPFDLSGQTHRSERGVGAHEIHLEAGPDFRSIACDECHVVPDELYSPGHVDDPYPADIRFTWPGTAFKAEPMYDAESQSCSNTFCHGESFVGFRPSGGTLVRPSWTDTSGEPSQCGSCHGLPPPLPHPQEEQCSDCHKTMNSSGEIVAGHLHVNGVINFYLPED